MSKVYKFIAFKFYTQDVEESYLKSYSHWRYIEHADSESDDVLKQQGMLCIPHGNQIAFLLFNGHMYNLEYIVLGQNIAKLWKKIDQLSIFVDQQSGSKIYMSPIGSGPTMNTYSLSDIQVLEECERDKPMGLTTSELDGILQRLQERVEKLECDNKDLRRLVSDLRANQSYWNKPTTDG